MSCIVCPNKVAGWTKPIFYGVPPLVKRGGDDDCGHHWRGEGVTVSVDAVLRGWSRLGRVMIM